MESKAVNIYAYSDARGVFFYNGNNASRDGVIDALIEDNKTTLTPKYEGYKITKLEGLGDDEAEIFTADAGVGNGVFVTGQRVPEKYIDITVAGAAGMSPEAYANYAKQFHHVGEWYKLNVQYQGRWVKVYGMLKNFKLETGNVFRRQTLTVSYMVPNPTIDAYWHDVFNIAKLPTYSLTESAASSPLQSEVIDVEQLMNAGFPKLVFKLQFNDAWSNATISNQGKVKLIFTYREGGVKKIKTWTIAQIYYNSSGYVYCITTQNRATINENCYFTLKLNLNPLNRKYSAYGHWYYAHLDEYADQTIRNNYSFTSQVPAGVIIEKIRIVVEKSDSASGSITWEAE